MKKPFIIFCFFSLLFNFLIASENTTRRKSKTINNTLNNQNPSAPLQFKEPNNKTKNSWYDKEKLELYNNFSKEKNIRSGNTISKPNKNLQPTISALENSYNQLFEKEAYQNITPPTFPLKQKAYEIFEQEIYETPISTLRDFNDDFILSEGDLISVSLYGSQDAQFEAYVDNQDQVFFPKVGVISIQSLNYKQVKEIITAKFQKYYLGSKVYIQLLSDTDRSVFVFGRVNQAGVKLIPQRSSLIEVFLQSKGISKHGSLRNIKITKKGNTQNLDLYNLLLSGEWNPISLMGGEKIFVPPLKNTIALVGEVLEPGIYEFTEKSTLQSILEKTQGISSLGHNLKINIFRPSQENNQVHVLTISQKDAQNFKLKNFDLIQILARDHLEGLSYQIKGAIHHPGTYQLKNGLSLKKTIEMAGGLKRLHSQYAFIERKLKIPSNVTLPGSEYGVLEKETIEVNLNENTLDKIIIQAGDFISIPEEEPTQTSVTVSIYGEVKEPGVYPYMANMNLYHLIAQSDGITENAHLQKLTISRLLGEDNIEHIHLNPDIEIKEALKQLFLLPGDLITIPSHAENTILVTASGEFNKPGKYMLPKGARLTDLIVTAGGFRHNAYSKGAAFYRRSVASTYDDQINKMADRLEQDLLRNQTDQIEGALGEQQTKNAMIFAKQERLVARLRTAKSLGRVAIIIPQEPELLLGLPDDIILEDGDELALPSEPSTVNIIGQVNNPNTVVYSSQYKVNDYINLAGGVTKNADIKNIFVIRANGMVIPAQKLMTQKKGWFNGRNSAKLIDQVEPGDTIIIPEDFEIQANRLQLTKDVSAIMFQIITSLGVVIAAF